MVLALIKRPYRHERPHSELYTGSLYPTRSPSRPRFPSPSNRANVSVGSWGRGGPGQNNGGGSTDDGRRRNSNSVCSSLLGTVKSELA